MPRLLQFSALLILSQYVFLSEQFQPCLGTSKPKGEDYTFALAQVDDYRDPVGPQEACFFSCGAQIVTQSSGRGDMNKLTLMDKAVSSLTASGFLKVGESYFLNHLGFGDEEGGNGMGCIEIKPGNKINHYPKSHAVCAMAKSAVCGFWGQQYIPPQPHGTIPKVLPSSKPPKIPPPKTVNSSRPRRTRRPKNTSKPTQALTTPLTTPKPTQVLTTPFNILPTVISEILGTTLVQPTTSVVSSPAATVIEIIPADPSDPMISKFEVAGSQFHVIDTFETSYQLAHNMCLKNQASIASVSSQSLPAVSRILNKIDAGKVIIGAWNGDTYSLSGNNCLILQTDRGIFPGSCTEAKAILCQS